MRALNCRQSTNLGKPSTLILTPTLILTLHVTLTLYPYNPKPNFSFLYISFIVDHLMAAIILYHSGHVAVPIFFNGYPACLAGLGNGLLNIRGG